MSSSDTYSFSDSSSVKVAVRVRPLDQREKTLNSNVIVHMDGRQTTLEATRYSNRPSNVETRQSGIQEKTKNKPKKFVYDYSYWSTERNDAHYISQEQVFKDLGTLVLDAAFEGYNACVFAYGQTGAGKTYTMMGEENDPGLIPRICKGLYGYASNSSNESFRIEVSYLEIYNEQVWDLLRTWHPDKNEVPASRLKVREHPREGPYVQGLTRHDAPDKETLESFLNQGNFLRTTASTNMNDQSSRSHAIFTITFTQAKFVAGLPSEVTSKVHLVDLAGSERVSKSGATGDRLKEGGNINKSLSTLGLVISALAERSSQADSTQRKLFIPYRDSILTWLLKDSLGGNSKTIMIAAISPSDSSYGETLSTLRYADRAKNIVNVPTVNEDPNVKLIRELKSEIGRLKAIITGGKIQIPSSLTCLGDVDQAQRLLEGTESKMAKHLQVWAEKWRDTLHIIEGSDLGLEKHGSALRIDMDPPHLVLLDDDPLNTSITIFSLKEGDNFIGNSNSLKKQDLVFDEDEVKNEHCVLTYDTAKVMLTPKDGQCHVNTKTISESIKLSQGDIIELGEDIRLKFNFPLEANLLREKRKSGHFSGSMENVLTFTSSPINFDDGRPSNQALSPLTDESGVEVDMFELNDEESTEKMIVEPVDVTIEVSELNDQGGHDKRSIDDLRGQVEELFAKYKESEIERFEEESRNQIILEQKENEIQEQTRKLIELQKNDEALLQQYHNELEALRAKLSEKKNNVRVELDEEIGKLFTNVISKQNEMTELSKKELGEYRGNMREQLGTEWAILDQYESKLIEVEAERITILGKAELKLKKEKERSNTERQNRLSCIDEEKSRIQGVLEGEIQTREVCKNEYKLKKREIGKCREKLERGIEVLVKRIGEKEWAQSRLSGDEGDLGDEEIYELVQTVKYLGKDVEGLEMENEKQMSKLSTMQDELCENAGILKTSEENVQKWMSEFEGMRGKFADCQQRFGEELGDTVNIVYQERDAELEKIESEKELIMSQHLERQVALEVLLNDGFERIGDEASHTEERRHVAQLIRSASPGIETNSLQSDIIEKKVQIHLQQMDLGEKENEKRTLYDKKEQQFLALRQTIEKARENEQCQLLAKIQSLELLLESQGNEPQESAEYLESESSNLMNAQRHIVNMDKELRDKIRERRDIENRLESLNLQVELQAESSQELFRGDLENLRERAKQNDEEINEMKQRFQTEADQYLMRLSFFRRESFVVLEKNIVNSCYTQVGNRAVDEILEEIEFASHVPELAQTYRSMTQDCNGWRYDAKERDVDLLRKESKNNVHCFLGRGIIRSSPNSISQTVSNPISRFVYDRMLKNIRIVENIADELKIVYMLHETSHCFIKQSRDFCFVTFDKEKDGKLILASQSVEHPSCPEVQGIVRAKILSSGWVIEPITIKGQLCSLVWYLTRVYLGTSLPSRLVTLVSKRQPLSIAYLREYLISEN